MKIRPLIIFVFAFMVVYVVAINISALFLFSFSTSKPGSFTKLVEVFIHFPLNPIADGLNSKQFLVFQILDGFFWGIIIYAFIFLVRRALFLLQGRKSNNR